MRNEFNPEIFGWTKYSVPEEGNFFDLGQFGVSFACNRLAVLKDIYWYTGKAELLLQILNSDKTTIQNIKESSDVRSIPLNPLLLGFVQGLTESEFETNEVVIRDITDLDDTVYEDEPPGTTVYYARGFEVVSKVDGKAIIKKAYIPEKRCSYGIQYVHELQNIYEEYLPLAKPALDEAIRLLF